MEGRIERIVVEGDLEGFGGGQFPLPQERVRADAACGGRRRCRGQCRRGTREHAL